MGPSQEKNLENVKLYPSCWSGVILQARECQGESYAIFWLAWRPAMTVRCPRMSGDAMRNPRSACMEGERTRVAARNGAGLDSGGEWGYSIDRTSIFSVPAGDSIQLAPRTFAPGARHLEK